MNKFYLAYLVVLPTMFFFSSCATLFNSPQKKIQFFSEEGIIPFSLNEDSLVYYTDTVISVKRSGAPLVIRVNPEENTEIFTVDSKLSNTYVLGNIFNYFIGYLFDLASPKMYSYPGKIELSTENKVYAYRQFAGSESDKLEIHQGCTPKKLNKKNDTIRPGRINLSLNLLSFHSFNWDTSWGRDNDNWSISAGLGLEYYLKPDLYLSGGIEGMFHCTNQMISFFDYDVSNISKALLGKVQVGKKMTDYLWLDAGLQMNHSYWYTKEHVFSYDSWLHALMTPFIGPNIEQTNRFKEAKNNYGFALGLKFKARNGYLRFDYYPSFLTHRFDSWKWEYNHIWGISFGGLIRLKN